MTYSTCHFFALNEGRNPLKTLEKKIPTDTINVEINAIRIKAI